MPYETVEKPEEPKPEPVPEESQIERFDRLHASPLDRTDELLTQLRDASRDTNAVAVDGEWRYARACLDDANALQEKDAKREFLTFEGFRAAERAALAPDDGLAQVARRHAWECGRLQTTRKDPELLKCGGARRRTGWPDGGRSRWPWASGV